MDRFDAMAVLLLVVEKGSFTAAAKALRMPLPTVSRKVNELEIHLGTKLLLRTTRKLALTDAGQAYVEAAKRILEQVAEAERVATGEYQNPRGELVLTAPLLFGRLHLLPVVADFLQAYPDINVRLVLSDRNLQLIDDHVDMAVRIGELPDSSMVATRVGMMRKVVCASPALLDAYDTPERPEDLAVLPSVGIDLQIDAFIWKFRDPQTQEQLEISRSHRLAVTTAEAAVSAAIAGIGATFVLHYQCVEAVRDGSLRLLLTAYEPPPVPVSLVHAARGALPSKMRVFLDFAAERLRERLRFIESDFVH